MTVFPSLIHVSWLVTVFPFGPVVDPWRVTVLPSLVQVASAVVVCSFGPVALFSTVTFFSSLDGSSDWPPELSWASAGDSQPTMATDNRNATVRVRFMQPLLLMLIAI